LRRQYRNIAPVETAEMDVDGDVDSQLLQQFSSMATTDREVLIAEFQRLLGNRLSDAGCAFFLDMNNWQVIVFLHWISSVIAVQLLKQYL